jgi:RNA polymerase sigma factor (sigma-70 family)
MRQSEVLDTMARPETEKTLLSRVRDGDMDAFAELVKRNRRSALVVAGSLVDATTAEDVVADSFERLLVTLGNGGGPTECLRPYLLQMVRHRAIDSWRNRREHPVEPATLSAATDVLADLDDAGPATGTVMVRTAFEALPQRWQTVLWLGEVEGCSYAEIGRELGLQEGAVTQLLHRAREGMRQSYLKLNVSQATGECAQIRPLLAKYVRLRSGGRDRQRVAQHLETCSECAAATAKLRLLNGRMGVALAATVAAGAAIELLRRPATAFAAELGPFARLLSSKRVRRGVGAAAGVALVLLVLTAPMNVGDTSAARSLGSADLGSIQAPAASPAPTMSRVTSSASAKPRSSAKPVVRTSRKPVPSTVSPRPVVKLADVSAVVETSSDGVSIVIAAPPGTKVSMLVTFSASVGGSYRMDPEWSCNPSTETPSAVCTATVTDAPLEVWLQPTYEQPTSITVKAMPVGATDPDLSNNSDTDDLYWNQRG